MFSFAQLDPRPAAAAQNEAIFASGHVYGCEVTLPQYAAKCVANLDHHGPGDTADTPSAVEQALTASVAP